ncbi:TetR-like C-terminal domain-containing protein [Nocardia sp. NPDC051570]|uniref:TetR-like C-terminal domain-containing protein n=1 Tax=Nocardia sp. NPDC051570 TaxID=3364324 RepID=UPI0037A8FFB1
MLHTILDRARARGELSAETDLEILIDHTYGVPWSRLTVARTPLDAEIAARLIDSLRIGDSYDP